MTWQTSVAASGGHGIMGSQSSRDGSTHEAVKGGLNPLLPRYVATPSEDSGGEETAKEARKARRAGSVEEVSARGSMSNGGLHPDGDAEVDGVDKSQKRGRRPRAGIVLSDDDDESSEDDASVRGQEDKSERGSEAELRGAQDEEEDVVRTMTGEQGMR